MKVLVTGAAGYIGSVVTELLVKEGIAVVGVDNLSQGHRQAVAPGAALVEGDVGDASCLGRIFSGHAIDAVLHLAANSIVESSMTDPALYFRNNVTHGINLLDAMTRNGVKRLVFSSSAAVYGEPASVPVTEEAAMAPVNAYGETKLMFERILKWFERAHGLKHISLRYFNAAGASENYGEVHSPETHLVPNILKVALGKGGAIRLFGDDYPTLDGTCVRDYIHVSDIARAHILALRHIDRVGSSVYNMGNGNGFSVKEVIGVCRKVSGHPLPVEVHPRRAGDPPVLVASAEKIRRELGWRPDYPGLEDIVRTAWEWHRKYPEGYSGAA
ncbi:MAG: UDP-glucose 4-epimerase GalE [Chloroflexi bacterium]|nr:UDP-glucose 4-epimerase GalE [Chloroflexota bacterium]